MDSMRDMRFVISTSGSSAEDGPVETDDRCWKPGKGGAIWLGGTRVDEGPARLFESYELYASGCLVKPLFHPRSGAYVPACTRLVPANNPGTAPPDGPAACP
jgi:hypothetical protein